jgi:starch-binding outer membrane protein, SusD/RagB family
MNNIYKKISVCLLIIGFTSCTTDDYVDIEPAFSVNSENYFNSERDYQLALIASYDLLQTTYLNSMLGLMASDDALAGGENANDVPAFQEIDDMTHTPVNDQLRNIWNWMYAGINRTNYIFEFKDKTAFESKNNVLGQTAFLRAYYYFELVKFFGDVPMPIDKRVSFGEESNFPKVPKSQVYTQIENDLIFAIENLLPTQTDLGRATKSAAQALLGKVYLYQNKFSDAATVLEEVINTGGYDLVSDYEGLFLASGENGIESVFEVQYSDLQGGSFGCFQCVEGNIAVGFNGIRGYSGPIYTDGFSFNVLTLELVDDFESGDIRFNATILDIESFASAQTEEVQYSEGYEHTGYYNQKYIPRKGEQSIGDTHLTSNKNYRSIRFSDVLLMAAEALNRGAISDDRAATYLNRVRTRADLPSVSLAGPQLTDAIYHERRVELAGEGHRFFDLVRTGRAASEIDGFITGKHEVFPLPLIEIQLAGNIWDQNPNY